MYKKVKVPWYYFMKKIFETWHILSNAVTSVTWYIESGNISNASIQHILV